MICIFVIQIDITIGITKSYLSLNFIYNVSKLYNEKDKTLNRTWTNTIHSNIDCSIHKIIKFLCFVLMTREKVFSNSWYIEKKTNMFIDIGNREYRIGKCIYSFVFKIICFFSTCVFEKSVVVFVHGILQLVSCTSVRQKDITANTLFMIWCVRLYFWLWRKVVTASIVLLCFFFVFKQHQWLSNPTWIITTNDSFKSIFISIHS